MLDSKWMVEPQTFCREVLHDYERQWASASGHAVRHPLRLKMNLLQDWCEHAPSREEFEARLERARASDDPGEVLLAQDLLPMWQTVVSGGSLPFERRPH